MSNNKNRKVNKDCLDELNKGCAMGMDSLRMIMEKVQDKKFKKVLENEFDKYKGIHQRIEDEYNNYSYEEPTETSPLNKIMTKSMTEMKLMKDYSDGKIAELLMQGTNMGIIEGRRLMNHKDNLDKNVAKILSDFVDMQEESVEIYKEYL